MFEFELCCKHCRSYMLCKTKDSGRFEISCSNCYHLNYVTVYPPRNLQKGEIVQAEKVPGT
jgi:hypothetical protein